MQPHELMPHNLLVLTCAEMERWCCRLLLKEKRVQLGSQAAKLRGGLTKLSETGQQVSLTLDGFAELQRRDALLRSLFVQAVLCQHSSKNILPESQSHSCFRD